jgi:hypothetical protein
MEKQQQKIKNGGGGGGYGGAGGGRTAPSRHLTVPLSHATVKQVLGSRRAVSLPSDSPLAVMTRPDGAVKYAVAMRVPLLHLSNFRIVCDLEPSVAAARCSAPFALMVLVLPSNSARRWHVHELELVEVVAEQVSVPPQRASFASEENATLTWIPSTFVNSVRCVSRFSCLRFLVLRYRIPSTFVNSVRCVSRFSCLCFLFLRYGFHPRS